MKLVYLVIDGAADSPSDRVTSLEAANTPGLDTVAALSVCGLMYPIARGVAPESDAAVLSLLSYDPHKYYTGRGPLEALGAGLRIKEGYEVAFRANFATVDEATLELVDRRVGRSLTSEEARQLAASLDGVRLGKYDAYARVKATIGHRAVVIIGSESYTLSDEVENTDPAYARAGAISVARPVFSKRISLSKPLASDERAERTAELVNIFTRKAIEILGQHPINVERERRGLLRANVILLRDAGGMLPRVMSIKDKFGLRAGAVVEMPVERGIAKLLDMEVAEVPPPSSDIRRDMPGRLEATLTLLKSADMVYVHLKGPDEPGHDGDFEGKVKALEAIDECFVKPLLGRINLEETAIIVTADHATPPSAKSHTGDPVPVAVHVPGVEADHVTRYDEKSCAKGGLGVLEHGWELLPRVVGMMRRTSP